MENKFEVSGERMTFGQSSKRSHDDHMERYKFAALYVDGKSVLDAACGTGYGSQLLSDAGASEVVGVDIDSDSIDYASSNHKSGNTSYLCSSVAKMNLPDEHFDLIVTFETIEHLEESDRAAYLEEIRRVLKPGGRILLSTPNKLITSPWSKKPLNPFHILEYYFPDLERELSSHGLHIQKSLGQRYVRTIFTKRVTYLMVRVFEKVMRRSSGVYEIADGPEVREFMRGKHPRYFVLELTKI